MRDLTEVVLPPAVPSPRPSSIRTLVGLDEDGLAVEAEVEVFTPSRVGAAVEVAAAVVAEEVVVAAATAVGGVLVVEVAPGWMAVAAAAVADFSAAIAVWNSFSMVSCSFK